MFLFIVLQFCSNAAQSLREIMFVNVTFNKGSYNNKNVLRSLKGKSYGEKVDIYN